jgi:hypothetical protein
VIDLSYLKHLQYFYQLQNYFVMVEKINQKDSLKLYEEYDLEEDDLEEID